MSNIGRDEGMNYEFIAVPKVVNHKVGLNAGAVLAILIYKYKYWNDQGRLTTKGNFKGFHISHSDIEEEVCLGTSAITKAITKLKKEGLISTKRQGQGDPNFYSVDEGFVEQYIEDHKQFYEDWRKKLRAKNSSKTPVNSWIGQNEGSRTVKSNDLDPSKSTTTKNKITKNKKQRISTNRINAEEEDFDQLDDLTEAVEALKSPDEDQDVAHQKLFILMKSLVPRFSKFPESLGDSKMIDGIASYTLDAGAIAFKILQNAASINSCDKEPRFGNLFVGLKEMDDNLVNKLG